MRHSAFAALLAGTFLAINAFAQGAAQFPTKPMRIIVGFPPGGSSDSAARLVAERLSDEFRQPVIIENKVGAGTTIAAAAGAAAPADGYTLLLVGPGTHATASAVYQNLSYDAIRSYAGVGLIGMAPFVVVVPATSKVTTMKELIELARSKPGQVSYSSSGSGAGPHLITEFIALSTGVKFLHVPFKGSAPATTALLGGQVDFSMADASAIPHIESGKMRGLAVTTATPSPLFRGVPTISEGTVPGFEYPLTLGLVAPAGTPRDILVKLNGALNRALANEEVRRRLQGVGLEAAPRTAEQFESFFAVEVRKYVKIVKDIGLKLD